MEEGGRTMDIDIRAGKCVIGGRLNFMSEGELRLVFQDGLLTKNNDHRHSCGGHVAYISMPDNTQNAGGILTCDKCHLRIALPLNCFTAENRDVLIGNLFKSGKYDFYCVDCKDAPLSRLNTARRCVDCIDREKNLNKHPDDLKK